MSSLAASIASAEVACARYVASVDRLAAAAERLAAARAASDAAATTPAGRAYLASLRAKAAAKVKP